MNGVLKNMVVLQSLLMVTAGSLWAADVPKGKELYGKKCASCHAKDLKGNPSMAKMFNLPLSHLDLVGKEAAAKSDKELIEITAKGKDKMPAQKTLSADEMADIIAYVRSVTPK